MVMVYVPAGPFTMGSNSGYPDEGPVHTVTLGAYWIDKIEVPNGAYALCVQAGACKPPAHKTSNGRDVYFGNPDTADYPVIFVNWDDAKTYCEWAGGRLPTEAEWEKAARGTDGRTYPWGNAAPEQDLANFGNNHLDTTADGDYPAGVSPYEALDMAGNVWEWTADWYSAEYYAQSPAENPSGPETGTLKVLRGGSWNFDAPGARTTYRLSKAPTFVSADIGFRCVRPAP
jgi:serine/threonine-protein kinase